MFLPAVLYRGDAESGCGLEVSKFKVSQVYKVEVYAGVGRRRMLEEMRSSGGCTDSSAYHVGVGVAV